MSTISAVLYANQNHPELKIEYPHWPDRYKQIMKKWRALSADKKQPYLQRARDNRSAQQAQLRTKKAQQVKLLIWLLKTQLHSCKSTISKLFENAVGVNFFFSMKLTFYLLTKKSFYSFTSDFHK